MTDDTAALRQRFKSLSDEIASLQKRKENKEKSLLDLREKMSEYVQPSEIPLQLQRSERETEGDLKKLEDTIGERTKELDEVRKQFEAIGLIPPLPPVSQHVPFTNRQDEMAEVDSSTAPAYHLLDAPAGYGKTELLKQLEQRFKERDWYCAYVAVDERSTVTDLANQLAKTFSITLTQESKLPWSLQLAGRLGQQWEGGLEKEGLVLLIDLEKRPSKTILQELLQEFIPNIESALHSLDYFAGKHNRFRVVVAGRYLATLPETKRTRLPLTIRRLSPFNYEVIRNSARVYLPKQEENAVDQLSAHLFFLTGGHPGCMASILAMYRANLIAPDQFLLYFHDTVWRDIVRRFVEDIRDGIPHSPTDLRKVLDNISVFRLLDYDILKSLNEDLISEDFTVINLADELTTTYLLNWKGWFLRDDITRRLLTIRLRHEKPEGFPKHCKEAQSICEMRLKQPNIQNSEIWTIEYLFQSLQQHANDIQDSEQRSSIRGTFMQKDIGEALKLFTHDRYTTPGSWRQAQRALTQAIEEDWEFRFTVNYFLREDQYNEEPYKKLQEQVERFFAQ